MPKKKRINNPPKKKNRALPFDEFQVLQKKREERQREMLRIKTRERELKEERRRITEEIRTLINSMKQDTE